MTAQPLEFPGFSVLGEPLLSFHPVRTSDTKAHPLDGLLEFGPYGHKLLSRVIDPIRTAAVVPHGEAGPVLSLIAELRQRHEPKERKNYLRSFPGFAAVFRADIAQPGPSDIISLPPNLDSDLLTSATPWTVLADAITTAIRLLERQREHFDVLLIYLPMRWICAFEDLESDFDLHDYIKAVTAQARIPCQLLREDSAMSYPCRASVAWRLGIALYCKAGGIPWKLVSEDRDTAFIGLSYTLRRRFDAVEAPQFVTCCSQAFDSDGAGLEFLTYSTDQFTLGGDNPYLSRTAMQHVMSRSLAMFQRRHGGQLPKRIVVHKSSDFRHDEVDGCFEAFQTIEEVDLIQVQQDAYWSAVQIDAPQGGTGKGKPSSYPSIRGTYLPLAAREVLLWTQGNAPTAVGGKDYYKEGRGIPEPLLLRRFAGHGGWHDTCRYVLGLTKMDWNSDALYTRLPVTLAYAQVLSRVVRRVSSLQHSNDSFQVRFFM